MTLAWTREQRLAMRKKINKAAKKAARDLGAEGGVIMICFFPDGEVYHMQDGGFAPMPPRDVYARLQQAADILEDTAADQVKLQ